MSASVLSTLQISCLRPSSQPYGVDAIIIVSLYRAGSRFTQKVDFPKDTHPISGRARIQTWTTVCQSPCFNCSAIILPLWMVQNPKSRPSQIQGRSNNQARIKPKTFPNEGDHFHSGKKSEVAICYLGTASTPFPFLAKAPSSEIRI